MPWKVVEGAGCPDSKPFAVVLKDSGEVIPGGCHETKQDALDHLKALYVNANAGQTLQFRSKGFGGVRRDSAEKELAGGFQRALDFVADKVVQTVNKHATTLVAAPVSLNPQAVYDPNWWETATSHEVVPAASAFYRNVILAVSEQLDMDPDDVEEQLEEQDLGDIEQLVLLYGVGNEAWVVEEITGSIERGEDLGGLTDTLTGAGSKFKGRTAAVLAVRLVAQIWNVASLRAGSVKAQSAAGVARLDAHGLYEDPGALAPTSTTPDQVLKIWRSMRDNKVRETHQGVDDDTAIPLNEDFLVGGYPASRPGDRRLPIEEVINCRCVLMYTRAGADPNADPVLSLDELGQAPDPNADNSDPGFAADDWEADPDAVDGDPNGGLQASAEREALAAEVERWNGNVTRMHTHGRCRRCGGYLTGLKGCQNCGAGYHAPGADGQPATPTTRERPAAVGMPTTTPATMSGELVDAGKVALGGVPEEAVMPVAQHERATTTPSELVPWRGVIAVEGVPTGDNRLFAEGSLWWDERYVPFDLFVMTRDPEGGSGHDGSEIGGRVDKIWRENSGATSEIWAEGVYDTSLPAGKAAASLQAKNMLKGVSIDVDSVQQIERPELSYVDLPVGPRMEAYSKGRIRRITVCSIPAFIEARISPIEVTTDVIPGAPATARSTVKSSFAVKFNPGGCKGKGGGLWAVMDGADVVDCYGSKGDAEDAEKKAKTAAAQRQFQMGGYDVSYDAVDSGGPMDNQDVLHMVARDESTCGPERAWSIVAPDGTVVACLEDRYEAYEAARSLDDDMYGCQDEGDGGGQYAAASEDDDEAQVVIVSSGVRRKVKLVDRLRVWTPVRDFGDAATQTLVASAAPSLVFSSVLTETDPPAEVLRKVAYNEFTPATIDAQGRISGHITPHGECHIGYTNRCVMAPKSRDGYRFARAGGHVLTAEGDLVPTARIFAQFTPGRRAHAPEDLRAAEAVAWYESMTCAVGDVAIYDDAFGIQVQGRVRPGITRHQLVAFRASDISPDWRTINGRLECVGLACVNVSGFPSRYERLPALVASAAEQGIEVGLPPEAEMVGSIWVADGKVQTLVASAVHAEERGPNLVLMSAIERMAVRLEQVEQRELAREAATLLDGVPSEDEVQAELEALVASALEGVDEIAPPTEDEVDEFSSLDEEEIDQLHALLVRLAEGQRPPRRCENCGARMSYDQNSCPNCGQSYEAETVQTAGDTEGFTVKFDPGACKGKGKGVWAVYDGDKVVDCFESKAEAQDAEKKAATQKAAGDTAELTQDPQVPVAAP